MGSYNSKRERYVNEPIGDVTYGSVAGRDQIDVGGNGSLLPPINPLAYVTNQQRYGLATQVVHNQSFDPRGDIDHKIPSKMKDQLIVPKNLGALLDRRAIVEQVRALDPVADSVTSYVGVESGASLKYRGPVERPVEDAELRAVYSDESADVYEL